MNTPGEIVVHLGLRGGRVARVDIASTRPDVAQALLQGRTVQEVQAAVPRLFSVCAHAQALAFTLACAAAGGAAAGVSAAAGRAVAAEHLREAAWQVLLQWPQRLGEVPSAQDVAAARMAADFERAVTGPGFEAADRLWSPLAQTLSAVLFGQPASAWQGLDDWPTLRRWAATETTAAARFVQHGLRLPAQAPPAPAVPMLAAPTPAWLAAVAAAAAADANFSRQPLQQGQPAETGALARLQGDLLFSDAALAAHAVPRPLARFVARLRELAGLLAGPLSARASGALALGPGRGVAWVETARGRLVHHVHLEGERVRLYRIVAPTEWNFHPLGAMAHGLLGAAVADIGSARRLAQGLVDSLDPCVACHVECAHA